MYSLNLNLRFIYAIVNVQISLYDTPTREMKKNLFEHSNAELLEKVEVLDIRFVRTH